MDNETLFKRIFSDSDRFMKQFRTYLDKEAQHPKLSCNNADLKRFHFKNTSNKSLEGVQNLLCLCEHQKPDLAKAIFECLKKNENDSHVLVRCEKEVDELNAVVRGVLRKLEEDTRRMTYISKACAKSFEDFKTNTSDETAAKFHSCFMPLYCNTQLKRALNCVNNNHEDLHGCETEIDDLNRCSIDNWHQHTFKSLNYKTKSEQDDDE